MNVILRRGLHLAALVAIGVIALSSGRFSGIAGAASPTPIPVSQCTTLGAGAYRLTTNITQGAAAFCFIVSEGTALDLGGHTITGAGDDCAVTDLAISAPNVIVTNGTITNFADGICMLATDSPVLTVDSVTITNSLNAGIYSASCCNTFTNDKANNNGGIGFDGTQGDPCCNTYANDQANSNGGEGIDAHGCCHLGNGVTANNNGDNTGIELDDGDNTVVNSVANGNHGYGMYLDGTHNMVEGSTANSNTDADGPGFGIFANNSDTLIDHSTANGNTSDGIRVLGNHNQITNSTASSNGGNGIELLDGTDHEVLRDVTGTNSGDGVVVSCPSNVSRLVSHNNGDFDLDLLTCSGSCTLLNNFAPDTISGCI